MPRRGKLVRVSVPGNCSEGISQTWQALATAWSRTVEGGGILVVSVGMSV